MTDTPAHLADDILNAWIDGIATPDEQDIVDHHIASCETCQHRLDELQGVKAMLASLPMVDPPRSFALTPEQAKKPVSIRERTKPSNIIRLLPIVRTLSVAAMLAVLILGGSLVMNQGESTMSPGVTTGMQSGETADESRTLGAANPAPAAQERGEIIDQGEAASAHDSTSTTLAGETPSVPIQTSDGGLTGVEIATIVVGVLALLLGVTWMWMSMAIRNGTRR